MSASWLAIDSRKPGSRGRGGGQLLVSPLVGNHRGWPRGLPRGMKCHMQRSQHFYSSSSSSRRCAYAVYGRDWAHAPGSHWRCRLPRVLTTSRENTRLVGRSARHRHLPSAFCRARPRSRRSSPCSPLIRSTPPPPHRLRKVTAPIEAQNQQTPLPLQRGRRSYPMLACSAC